MSLRETFQTSLDAELAAIGEEMVQVMRRYLERRGKDASGELIESITYEIVDGELVFVAKAEHAIYVHEGTSGHWPPKGALRSWVRTVGFAPGLSIESRDYLARKSVAESGTKATPFIQDPLTQSAEEIALQLSLRIQKDLQSQINATD
jgi:hypothetical protein